MSVRAREKPMKRVPHCLWIMVANMEVWWWEDIIMPRRRMMRAGKGFMEKE